MWYDSNVSKGLAATIFREKWEDTRAVWSSETLVPYHLGDLGVDMTIILRWNYENRVWSWGLDLSGSDRVQRWAFVNEVMDIRVPYKVEDFFTRFTRRTCTTELVRWAFTYNKRYFRILKPESPTGCFSNKKVLLITFKNTI